MLVLLYVFIVCSGIICDAGVCSGVGDGRVAKRFGAVYHNNDL